jgi:hypothetical protein
MGDDALGYHLWRAAPDIPRELATCFAWHVTKGSRSIVRFSKLPTVVTRCLTTLRLLFVKIPVSECYGDVTLVGFRASIPTLPRGPSCSMDGI